MEEAEGDHCSGESHSWDSRCGWAVVEVALVAAAAAVQEGAGAGAVVDEAAPASLEASIAGEQGGMDWAQHGESWEMARDPDAYHLVVEALEVQWGLRVRDRSSEGATALGKGASAPASAGLAGVEQHAVRADGFLLAGRKD